MNGMITHLRLKAYGKINLGLDVLGRREDGYHEVRMIMKTVRLHDSIDLYRTREPGIRLAVSYTHLHLQWIRVDPADRGV